MTSLSKGILKKRGADPVPYSEAPLEFFEPPEKKTAAEPVLPEEEPEDDVPETEEEQEEAVQEEARLRSSAELLLEQARRKAESLLLEAAKEAERIKEQAAKEGYTEGWERGCQEGKARAVEEGEQQDLLRRQEFHDSMARALEAIEKEKDACLRRYLEELKDLAVAVGEKVIRISLKSNGDVIRCMIEAETEKMKKKAWVRIYMEREDYETMIQADKDAVSHLARLSDNVKFIVMEQASGGSCIIEMPDEIIDMSVDTQIENIRRLVGELRF